MQRKRLVGSTNDSDEMRLKCLDGLFCDVSAVVIWWNELVHVMRFFAIAALKSVEH